MRSHHLLSVALVAALACGACKKAQPRLDPGAARALTMRSAELSPVRAGTVEKVDVPGDRAAFVVIGAEPRAIVYLHGMCSEPKSDLDVWARSVSALGTVLALEGDVPCEGRGGRTYTQDIGALDRRIDAAIAAVAAEHAVRLDEIVLVGESLGASRTIALASQFPARYPRLVLVGGPETPSPSELRRAKAVALLAGEKEPQGKMREGASALAGAGIPARFWELADATHGTYGPEGAASMTEAVAFVLQR